MIIGYEHLMDYVRMARANPKKTTSETLAMWREWLQEVYGPLCVEIDGKIYPPGTIKDKPFKGSILYKGETAAERRAIMNGEQVYEEYGLEIVEAAKKQLYEMRNRGRK